MACEETITSLIDSMWVIKQCILDSRFLIGGGAIEIELYKYLIDFLPKSKGIER